MLFIELVNQITYLIFLIIVQFGECDIIHLSLTKHAYQILFNRVRIA